MFKKIISLALAALMLVGVLAACGSGSSSRKGESAELLPRLAISGSVSIPADFKIGLITLHDENSTYDKNFIDGFKQTVEALGIPKDNYFVVSNIEESEACYNTAVDLAKNKGCKVIFADSFGHESYMIKAAEEFPHVQFCHATGTQSKVKNLPNYHNAFASIYEGRYCAGIAAGEKLNEMIQSGKITAEQAVIGYIGAFTYAEVISGMTSFFLGARSVCPSATMKVRYTGSWYDQGKEQEAAIALIDNDKCALISQHADSLGAPVACEERGVPNVSYNGSTYSSGKTTWLISSAINWAPYFQYIIENTAQGKAFDTDWCGTIATNSVVLSGLNQDVVTANTEKAINDAIAAFKAGTLHVFDTSKWTLNGEHLTSYLADVDGDFTGETNVIHDGYFDESNAAQFRSAPYFDIIIDGVENLNTAY